MANKINVVLGLETNQFTTGLNVAAKKLEQTSKKFADVGTTLSIGFTAPFAILAKTAADAFNVQAKAVAQVEAGLKSTGDAFNFTSQQLQKFASDLQSNSLFGDEEILTKVTAQFLTFGNIADENFQRAQQAALDLAARLDGDLQGAAIQLGKALQDPVKGITALSRSGVSFSEDQKALIGSLVETGRVADAQRLILSELEKQYGGSAAAAAAAGTGPITQANMAFGDLLEVIGKVVVEAITPLALRLKSVFEFLQRVNPSVLTFALGFGAVLAAIGPVLLSIGAFIKVGAIAVAGYAALTKVIFGIIPAIRAFALGINLATIKITLIVGAVLAVVAGLLYLYNNFETVRRVVNGVIETFGELFTILKEGAGNVFKGLGKILAGEFTEGGKLLADGLIKVNPVGIALTQGKRLAESFNKGYADESNKLEGIKKSIESFFFKEPVSVAVEPAVINPNAGSSGGGEGGGGGGGGGKRSTQAATPTIDPALIKQSEAVFAKLSQTVNAGFGSNKIATDSLKKSLEAIPDVISPIEQAYADLNQQIKDNEATLRIFGATEQQILQAKLQLQEQAIAKAIEAGDTESVQIQALIEAYKLLKLQLGEYNLEKENQENLERAVGAAIQQAGGIIQSALEDQALSFRSLAQSALAAAKVIIKAYIQEGVAGIIKNILAGPTGKIGLPALAIAAAGGAIASGLFSAAINKISAPKLARGGLVTGEQLAIVGDNPSGKEAIIPFERMGEFLDMAGGGSTRLSGLFEVRGQDLILVLDRANQSKSRIR